ncbi:hypothetical protein ZIOFF_069657 [Zingiber officinale]|uniref:Myb/SANT-like domain-containing protein n=1 Tax=Zingiber officinale TaxID=94328 RepID=A0A8J5C4G0_ZINOF|nr:hypothetical protein ZIOFF_069657 [Zingiber officinale]
MAQSSYSHSSGSGCSIDREPLVTILIWDSRMESNPEKSVGKNVARGRGKDKVFWTEEDSWALIRCLQDMTTDPLWKIGGGFKNNYMVEKRKIMIQKLATFTKYVSHIESRIKTLKRKFHVINEMCRQSGCTWNDVVTKIACEETWYLEWIKNHIDIKSLYNVSFPYFSELEMVYGKDRATGIVAEDPMMAAQNITDVDAGLTISDDNSLAKKGVEVDLMQNQQPSVTSRASHSKEKKKSSIDRVQKVSKRANTSTVQNVDSDFKLLNAQVEGFMQTVSSQFESMSSWVQGKSTKMPQVLEMLDKYGFIGKNKYKAAQDKFSHASGRHNHILAADIATSMASHVLAVGIATTMAGHVLETGIATSMANRVMATSTTSNIVLAANRVMVDCTTTNRVLAAGIVASTAKRMLVADTRPSAC